MKLVNFMKIFIFLINVIESINILSSIMINTSNQTLMKFSWDKREYSTYRYDYYVNHYSFYLSGNIWQLYSFLKFGIDNIAVGKIKSIFNDPDIDQQWYYVQNDRSLKNLSHELDRLWVRNITGKGVTIGIISHGFETNHDDIRDNYNPHLSYNFITMSPHIYSSSSDSKIAIAGLISAVANNNVCGAGAAPSSQISILQVLDDNHLSVNSIYAARAMLYGNQVISIYVIPFIVYSYPNISKSIGIDEIYALEKGYKYGRNGLGSIFIMASGIVTTKSSSCASIGYIQRPEIFVIGSITKIRTISPYFERCTAIIASTLNARSSEFDDLIYSTIPHNQCKNSVFGVCASSAISAGIVALLLSYNPMLTARQIMIIMIETSTQYDSYSVVNSAGFSYSTALGFGMLNATKMIEYSDLERIKYISEQHICSTFLFKMNLFVPTDSHRTVYIYTTGCVKPKYCVTILEQVYLVLTVKVQSRKSVSIYLISPSGTKLKIIEPSDFDTTSEGFESWSVKILGFYGEKPNGIWRFQIFSKEFSCWLQAVQIKFYGTCFDSKYNEKMYQNRKYMIWGSRRMDMTESSVEMVFSSSNEYSPDFGNDDHSRLRYIVSSYA